MYEEATGGLGGIWLQRNAKILVSIRMLKGVHPKETRESNDLDREKKRSKGLEFILGFYSTR
jgi:hypothetical protein